MLTMLKGTIPLACQIWPTVSWNLQSRELNRIEYKYTNTYKITTNELKWDNKNIQTEKLGGKRETEEQKSSRNRQLIKW
jgi:hypothetical protein